VFCTDENNHTLTETKAELKPGIISMLYWCQ